MRLLPILAERSAVASSRLANCRGCTSCCERGGLVYVKDDEREALSRLDVPMINISGVTFIKRLADGTCPMLDRVGKQCSIYEDRPLCCRLFPLDILSIDRKLQWAVSNQCPEERKLFSTVQGPRSPIGLGSVQLIASVLGASVTAADLGYFARKEVVSSKLDVLDMQQNSWTALAECVQRDTGSAFVMAKKQETPKQKFKRKLKKNKKKKSTTRQEKRQASRGEKKSKKR